MKITRQCLAHKEPTYKITNLIKIDRKVWNKCVRNNYCHWEREKLESVYKHLACIINPGLQLRIESYDPFQHTMWFLCMIDIFWHLIFLKKSKPMNWIMWLNFETLKIFLKLASISHPLRFNISVNMSTRMALCQLSYRSCQLHAWQY